MVRRLAEIAVVLGSAFGLGFLVWGSRLDSLASEVGFLSEVVRHQSREIQRFGAASRGPLSVGSQASACPSPLEPLAVRENPLNEQCVQDRDRLQDDLEACLFENARLSRRIPEPSRPQLNPRSGTVPIEEIFERTRVPGPAGSGSADQ